MQPLYGYISSNEWGNVQLDGTDGTPFVDLVAYYQPKSDHMEVNLCGASPPLNGRDEEEPGGSGCTGAVRAARPCVRLCVAATPLRRP